VISEGNVGLVQAIKRFEPDKGFRLAIYATWWIKAAIRNTPALVLAGELGTTANQRMMFFNLRRPRARFLCSTRATCDRPAQDHRPAARRHPKRT